MKGKHEDRKFTKPKGKDFAKYHNKVEEDSVEQIVQEAPKTKKEKKKQKKTIRYRHKK